MPILVTLATLAGGAVIWLWRARGVANAARGAAEMGRDVVGAARQWNFKRRTNVHPVDAVDDPAVAKGALATLFLELGGLPTEERRAALLGALRSRLDVPPREAEELTTLGHWLGRQCGGPAPGISRLSRRLARIDGPGAIGDVAALLEAVLDGEPTDAQADALAEISRRLGR